MTGNHLVVRLASVEEILVVRKTVLRPGEAIVASDYDATPRIRHVGAFDGSVAVACATVYPSPYDGEPDAWQLRGMAVLPERQGSGIGASVLRAAVATAWAEGAPFVWANARVTALPFYLRLGWLPRSEVFDYGPSRLPHKVIVQDLRNLDSQP